MAQKVQYLLIDDLDGSNADETIYFGFEKVNYEIDLSAENAQRFRELLEPYIKAARKVGRQARGATPKGRTAGQKFDLVAVRAWARSQGHEVSDRGRVPTAILEAYERAHS